MHHLALTDSDHCHLHRDYHRLIDESLRNPNSVRKKLNRESICMEFEPPALKSKAHKVRLHILTVKHPV